MYLNCYYSYSLIKNVFTVGSDTQEKKVSKGKVMQDMEKEFELLKD